jgi:hypothetical protein
MQKVCALMNQKWKARNFSVKSLQLKATSLRARWPFFRDLFGFESQVARSQPEWYF